MDQFDLSGTEPAFQFFLPSDGGVHVVGFLKPNQAIAVVARSESFVCLGLVFEDALAEVACDSDVEGTAFADDYVGEVDVIAHAGEDRPASGVGRVFRVTSGCEKQILRLPPPS